MRYLKFILLLAITMTLLISLLADHQSTDHDQLHNDDDENAETESISLVRGVSRFLAQKTGTHHRLTLTKCNKYPRICRVRGSPGPDCCKKRCVNVVKDRNNCGRCGKKCKYSEICCRGKCVNPLRHNNHCGGCNNKCGQGSKCTYGMCSYAN